MRTVSLPDSDREVTIGVFHKKFNRETGEVLEYKDPAQESFFVRRCTFVKLTDRANTTFGDGEISVMSICMPGEPTAQASQCSGLHKDRPQGHLPGNLP
jgi:hypothetical protein